MVQQLNNGASTPEETEGEGLEGQFEPGGFIPNRARRPSSGDTDELADQLRRKFPVVRIDPRIHREDPDRRPQSRAAAKPQKRVRPAAPTQSPSQSPSQSVPLVPLAEEGTPRPSLRDQLLQRAKGLGSAEQLRRTLGEAEEAGATPEIVNLFAELVRRGDEIGIRRYSFSRSPEEARQEWFNLPWTQWEGELHAWAAGGDMGAKEVEENLNLFARNPMLRDLLRDVAVRFVRPCGQISTYGSLARYLENLTGKLAQRVINPNPQRIPERGVVIRKGRETYLYLPLREVRLSFLGWPFVKEAEARAEEHAAEQEKKAEALMTEVTPGLTPLKVSAGEEGNLFLSLGWNRGVLIEAKKQNGTMIMARVAKAVGIWISGGLPSDWILWSPDTGYVPLRGSQWPLLEEIPKALKMWEVKLQQPEAEQERRKQEREKTLLPVTSLATLPIPFEGQGLTRLLKGEVGTAAICNWTFEWGRTKGLFAVAIERCEGGELLRLREFVTYHPFPPHLRGKQLPRLETGERGDGSLKVQYAKRFSGMKPEVFRALRMVEKAIQMCLNAEHRALLGEPAPDENNHTG